MLVWNLPGRLAYQYNNDWAAWKYDGNLSLAQPIKDVDKRVAREWTARTCWFQSFAKPLINQLIPFPTALHHPCLPCLSFNDMRGCLWWSAGLAYNLVMHVSYYFLGVFIIIIGLLSVKDLWNKKARDISYDWHLRAVWRDYNYDEIPLSRYKIILGKAASGAQFLPLAVARLLDGMKCK